MIRSWSLRVRARVREFLLLEQAERLSSALTVAQRSSLRAYYNAALRRLRTAQELRLQHDTGAALLLYRQGNLFLMLAFVVSRDATVDPGSLDAEAALSKFEATLDAERIAAPSCFARTTQVLRSRDPLELDRLSAREASLSAEDLEMSGTWLAELIDPHSPNEIRAKRVVRLAAASVLGLAVVSTSAVWALSPPNLALHKPATASSQAYETTPEGAVDGSRYAQLGFHSAAEESPWLAVDLGRPHEINRVKVYGRGDCCFDQSIPLTLEASDDGITYRKVDERHEAFSQFDPWVTKPRSLVARFVRLKTMHHSVLVVGELEVYGRPAK